MRRTISENLQKLPPYTYVPGLTPHPVSDSAGHAFGQFPVSLTPAESAVWGIHLFNHGFYWEAHETWEAAWKSLGRSGGTAEAFKGLIKLAAAGVKSLEGNAAGVRRHATRANEIFSQLSEGEILQEVIPLMNVDLAALIDRTGEILQSPPLASEQERQQATHSGVPILGQLPIQSVPHT